MPVDSDHAARAIPPKSSWESSALQDRQGARDVPNGFEWREADAITHRRFIGEEITELNAFQHFVDALLEKQPHWANTAILGRRAALGVNRMAYAVEIEGGEFGRLNHIPHGDCVRISRERVPASGTSRAIHDTGAAHPQEDLLDVVTRQLLTSRHVSPSHRAGSRATREMQGTNESVFRPRRNAHKSSLWLTGRADKFSAGKARHEET